MGYSTKVTAFFTFTATTITIIEEVVKATEIMVGVTTTTTIL